MLEIRNLTKVYKNGKRAVDGLSLTVADGDIYGFIGHNGAGKSTTIKSVVGVLDFDAGEIRIDGHDVKREPLACKQVTAYIPDNPDLYEHLSGIQYLNFIADVFGVPATKKEQRIREYGERLEIVGALGDSIGSYSHGMRQKVAILSALVHEPRLMVLDEPFVGLDPKASLTLKEIMRELCGRGSAIFFSTHVLEVAQKLCNKVAIIRGGRLVVDGDMERLVRDHSLEELFMEVTEHE